MPIHLLAPPNIQTTHAYPLDGFGQLTSRMAGLLRGLGHSVTIYGGSHNTASCHNHVVCIREDEQRELLAGAPYQSVDIRSDHPLWQRANTRMIAAVAARKQPHDLLLTISGDAQQPVFDAHPDLLGVEYSIGYIGSFARHRVFQSHAWQHWTYGRQGIHDGRHFDTVIPCFYDPTEFPYQPTPADYVVYCGRLTPRKGIAVACQVAKAAGVSLKVIGHGDASLVTYGDYLGEVSVAARNTLLANARAVLCPTAFIEPFNQVAVEAQLCGTPAITTDFGGFTETVEDNVTGFRCHTIGEFVRAIQRANSLDRGYIRQRALAKYSIRAVAPLYQAYFDRLALLWDRGWETGA